MRKIGLLARLCAMRRLALGVVIVAAALAPASPAAAAQAAGPAAAPETPPPPPDQPGRGTPQSSLRGSLEAATLHNYRRATNTLDLRRPPKGVVAARAPALATQLRVVLDNTAYDLGATSDEREGWPEAGLPKNRQLIGRVETDKGTFSMYLERVPRDDGVMIWQFSNVTVSR